MSIADRLFFAGIAWTIFCALSGFAVAYWGCRLEQKRMYSEVLTALGWGGETTDTKTWHMLINAIWTHRVMVESDYGSLKK